MKKLFLFALVATAATFGSCTKDRTCTCTTIAAYTVTTNPSSTTQTGSTTTTDVVTYQKSRKSDARANCLDATWTTTDTQPIGLGTTQTTVTNYTRNNCSLK